MAKETNITRLKSSVEQLESTLKSFSSKLEDNLKKSSSKGISDGFKDGFSLGTYDLTKRFNELTSVFQEKYSNISKGLSETAQANFKKMKSGLLELYKSSSPEEFAKNKKIFDGLLDDIRKSTPELKSLTYEAAASAEKFNAMKTEADSAKKAVEGIKQDLSSFFSPLDKLSGVVSKFPIIGKAVSNSISRVKSEAIDAMQKQLAAGEGSLSALGSGVATLFKGMNPWIIALGLVLAALYGIYKLFMNIENATREFVKETGAVNEQWKTARDTIIQTHGSLAKYGVSAEVAAKSAASVYNTFAGINNVTDKLVRGTALMVSNLGMSADEAASTLREFKALGNLSDEQSVNMTAAVARMAELGGVAPKRVLADMAKNASFLNTYFRGSTEEMAKAAIHAARLGLSLSSIEKMSKDLMEWDTSIEKEMNATVMLGRQMNFQNARRLIWEGKIAEATDEILAQVGTLDDFNKLNYMQKKAVAEAAGMEVSELTKTLNIQESLKELGPAQRAEYDYLLKAMQEQKKLSGEQMLADIRQQTELQKLSQAWEGIIGLLTKFIVPILNKYVLPLVEQLTKYVNDFTDSFNGSTEPAKELSSIFNYISISAQTLFSWWKLLWKVISSILSSDLVTFLVDALGAIMSVVNYIITSAVFNYIVDGILWIVNALGTVVKWVLIIGGVIGSIVGVIALLFNPITWVIGLVLGLVAAIGYLADNWTAVSKVVGDYFYSSFIYPIQAFISLLGDAWTSITSIFDWVGQKINMIWDIIKPILTALNPIKDLVSSIFGGGNSITATVTSTESPVPMASGGIVEKPTNILAGESGREAIIPLGDSNGLNNKELIEEIQKLGEIMKNGFSVYMDGKKVGEALISANPSPAVAYPY